MKAKGHDLPAGGCVVPVICITTTDVAHDNDPASQSSCWNRSSVGSKWNNFVMQIPVKAPRKCPPKSALGCARGTSTAPYMRTAVAPYGKRSLDEIEIKNLSLEMHARN